MNLELLGDVDESNKSNKNYFYLANIIILKSPCINNPSRLQRFGQSARHAETAILREINSSGISGN